MYQTASKELFQRYMNPVFIESGSFMGDGIQMALDAGFKKIYSIELSENLYRKCVVRFRDNENVNLIFGDSHLVLDDLLIGINERVTFWLDGHWAGDDTAIGRYESPLIQELEAIGRHHIKNHIILIDDLRCWNRDVQGFDTEIIRQKCLEINPAYRFTFENGYMPNDILAAW